MWWLWKIDKSLVVSIALLMVIEVIQNPCEVGEGNVDFNTHGRWNYLHVHIMLTEGTRFCWMQIGGLAKTKIMANRSGFFSVLHVCFLRYEMSTRFSCKDWPWFNSAKIQLLPQIGRQIYDSYPFSKRLFPQIEEGDFDRWYLEKWRIEALRFKTTLYVSRLVNFVELYKSLILYFLNFLLVCIDFL